MGWYCNGFGWGGTWGSMVLNMVLFAGALAVLGLAAVWLARQLGRRPATARADLDPLEIARRRLAAGEINVAEFEEIRNRIRS